MGGAEPEPPGGPHRRLSSATATAAATSSTATGRPKILRAPELVRSARRSHSRTCATAMLRWSGNAVTAGSRCPTSCGRMCEFGRGRKYSDNQAEHMVRRRRCHAAFDEWTDASRVTCAQRQGLAGRVSRLRPPSAGPFVAESEDQVARPSDGAGIPAAPERLPRFSRSRSSIAMRRIFYKRGEGAKLRD